jgi:hypothetical protein
LGCYTKGEKPLEEQKQNKVQHIFKGFQWRIDNRGARTGVGRQKVMATIQDWDLRRWAGGWWG